MRQLPFRRIVHVLALAPTVYCTLLLFLMHPAIAQQDSTTLSPQEFLNVVRKYHPVARQASLLVETADARLRASRGFFDPSVYFSHEQKTFDSKNYYNYSIAELKVPTWFGIELGAGIENNNGDFVNPETTIGRSSYAGIMVPLAKNLVMDNRRAALQQAKLLVSQSQVERELVFNDLLFDAIASYWEWVKEYQVYKVLSNAVVINEQRYKAIRQTVEQGDRAGVDSTEALTQLLTFRSLQNEAYMNFLNAGYELSNFLWTEEDKPYILPPWVVPSVDVNAIDPYSIPQQPLVDLLASAAQSHPKLQAFGYKLDALEIERKLKFQSMLPTLNFKYNTLADSYQFWKNWNATSLQNNYKFGVDFGIPILLRQSRGEYKATKLKIDFTNYDRSITQLQIENKVKQYYNQMVNILQQLRFQEDALQAYRKVYEIELLKFEIGESSIFLINARENKVLESQQKVAEVRAKFFKSLYGVQWSAGLLR